MGSRVVVAADSAGFSYKELIRQDLKSHRHVDEVIDAGLSMGEDIDYPHVAVKAARMIVGGEADFGIFLCGTGMGMAISANKVKGIRACTAHDSYSVERLVLSNNAQVLCLGARVIGPELARRLASEFLEYTFDPRSHSKSKVDEISSYEEC